MQRGDDIVLWSNPKKAENLIKPFEDVVSGPTFYNRELEFLKQNSKKFGYDFNNGLINGTFSK